MSTENCKDDHEKKIVKDGKTYHYNEQTHRYIREITLAELLTPYGMTKVSDGTLWEGQIALYFRWTCLPDCAVPELDADYRRNNRRLS